jgi:RHS repeat-associated protein
VTQINDGATLLVLYEYLGESTVVDKDYSGIDVMQRRYGTSSGSYPAFDRFNRIVEDTWTKDLATDVDIYHVDITYDRNSNITELDEVDVHVGFDAKITVDGLDRVSNVQEGTLSGGSITSETREQTWTLMDQVGNWEHVKLDLDGDGSYGGTDEYDDDRTHNEVNELTGRDTDDNGSDDHTLVYDEAGNLTDDGESYKYDYDVWYRLRKVNKQSDALLAEHRYNGLGHRIAEHTDTDVDGDVDANDDWHHFAYDERWRAVAMFVESDTTPTEEFVHQNAGAGGQGGASYIDEVVLRDRDTDDNGSLDERVWYCQNRRYDVVTLVDDSGDQREMVRYSAYGVPFGLPGGDADSDGDCDVGDSVDSDAIQQWIDTSQYDVRGDLDLDADVDSDDKAIAETSPFTGASLRQSQMSLDSNRSGASGRRWAAAGRIYENRLRSYSAPLGRWMTRDPLGYVDGASLYWLLSGQPATTLDVLGAASESYWPPSSVLNHPTTGPRPYALRPYQVRCGGRVTIDQPQSTWLNSALFGFSSFMQIQVATTPPDHDRSKNGLCPSTVQPRGDVGPGDTPEVTVVPGKPCVFMFAFDADVEPFPPAAAGSDYECLFNKLWHGPGWNCTTNSGGGAIRWTTPAAPGATRRCDVRTVIPGGLANAYPNTSILQFWVYEPDLDCGESCGSRIMAQSQSHPSMVVWADIRLGCAGCD